MNKKRIVITGGPGTGKTVLISSLEEKGFYCFHEVIRTMTLAALDNKPFKEERVNPIAFVNDSKSFNDQLLMARLQHFKEGEKVNRNHLFYDRGLPDVIAYMDYFNQSYDQDYIDICRANRYDDVLLLPPWKAIYVQDNERLENFEQAQAIHQQLENTYTQLGYTPVQVPFGTIAERLQFVTDFIVGSGE